MEPPSLADHAAALAKSNTAPPTRQAVQAPSTQGDARLETLKEQIVSHGRESERLEQEYEKMFRDAVRAGSREGTRRADRVYEQAQGHHRKMRAMLTEVRREFPDFHRSLPDTYPAIVDALERQISRSKSKPRRSSGEVWVEVTPP